MSEELLCRVYQSDRDASADFMSECAPYLGDCGMKNSVELALRHAFAKHRTSYVVSIVAVLAASRAREVKLREALQKIARNWSIVFNSPGMSTNEAVDMARAALSASEDA